MTVRYGWLPEDRDAVLVTPPAAGGAPRRRDLVAANQRHDWRVSWELLCSGVQADHGTSRAGAAVTTRPPPSPDRFPTA